MDTSNENSAINTTTHETAEKTPNIKETSNQNNDNTSQNINYANILNSQEHQVNYKRPESTSSPQSPKPPSFNMKILPAKNNSNKDKTSKKNQNSI
ncbi:unnamed protein product [Macrosiphum euphorbiae]|uniref:Uncharacterized protein n=1 Tax=Macrosiphum euphorbiae TaxID=13131 RepID=A0AAV0X7P0_9HEMI|nr:unnamed protein product [Macrosiphum euphorbiae]